MFDHLCPIAATFQIAPINPGIEISSLQVRLQFVNEVAIVA